MLCKTLATLLLAATALATPAPEVTATAESFGTESDNDAIASAASAADAFLADIPDSILSVMETAVPTSWQMDILTDPAFRASVASAAAEGSYPAWYNELPSSVKAWATSVGVQILEAGSSYQGASQTVSQTASNAALTTSAGSSHATASHSSSSSASASASTSASSSQSTGGAPAPTGGVAMAVAGGAGILALALAL
ncbi:hypothetical protein HFD88_004129 [Aspergillus terreus]|nr:hypothetical protein HFD88_004129 [Aspergillus terreus]